jgi:hypothetical protein
MFNHEIQVLIFVLSDANIGNKKHCTRSLISSIWCKGLRKGLRFEKNVAEHLISPERLKLYRPKMLKISQMEGRRIGNEASFLNNLLALCWQ